MIKGSCCHRHAKGKRLRVVELPSGKYGIINHQLMCNLTPGMMVPYFNSKEAAEKALYAQLGIPKELWSPIGNARPA